MISKRRYCRVARTWNNAATLLWSTLLLSVGCTSAPNEPSPPALERAAPSAGETAASDTAPAAESAKSVGAAEPKSGAAAVNSLDMKFVLIPAGNFLRGSPDSDPDVCDDEKPEHVARITTPFYLGVYEVTQAEYERVMGGNPSFYTKSGPTAPVENVSWENTQEFCHKLSSVPEEQAAGRAYRLPTAAEWEYACLAGARTRYSFGDDASDLGDYAWFGEDFDSHTHPVGQKKPNAWGLYDMHGNVWEWCADYGSEEGYAASPREDPRGPEDGMRRESRGGSWGSVPAHCRAAFRSSDAPDYRYRNLGFRVAYSRSGT